MKINLLRDYLQENGLMDSYKLLSDTKTFGHLYIDGKIYPIYLSLSDAISDDICNSVVINRKRYRFCVESIPIDKIITIDD